VIRVSVRLGAVGSMHVVLVICDDLARPLAIEMRPR